MRKTITVNYLRKLDACPEAIESFQAQEERDTIKLLRKYLQAGYYDWVNWLIVRLMNRKQRIKYKVLERDSRGNREAARTAARAAAADVAYEAAYVAANAARTDYTARMAAAAVADVMTGAEAKIIEYGIVLLEKGELNAQNNYSKLPKETRRLSGGN